MRLRFDAAIGDPEGEMEITPVCFGALTGLLASHNIPLVVLLEGGYFLESLGESAEAVLNALIERVVGLFPTRFTTFSIQASSTV